MGARRTLEDVPTPTSGALPSSALLLQNLEERVLIRLIRLTTFVPFIDLGPGFSLAPVRSPLEPVLVQEVPDPLFKHSLSGGALRNLLKQAAQELS